MNGLRTLGYLTLDASPSPIETIDAAADGGFRSVGIRISGRRRDDPFPTLIGNRGAVAEARSHAADRGVLLSNASAYQLHPDVASDDLMRVVDAVGELGSRTIVVNVYLPDESLAIDTLARYGELCMPANIRLAVEFVPFSSVRSIEQAHRLVQRVGTPNLALVIDPLHLARSGGHPEALRGLDPATIAFVQLCDAKGRTRTPTTDELRRESRTRRLLPGDGDLPLEALFAVLPRDVEVEYEVPREDFAALTLAERARVAYSVCNAYLDALPRR